jgi:predicted PhzF superfamily epimerase YddE/YHI9
MKLYQVDAFTAEAFKGNPAGVCMVDDISNALSKPRA